MPPSNSRLSYSDCFDLMDRALDDLVGTRAAFPDYGSARHYQSRVNYARKLDRAANKETYADGHPMHGQSQYDRLTAKVRQDEDGQWWVYLEHTVPYGVVESLSEKETEA